MRNVRLTIVALLISGFFITFASGLAGAEGGIAALDQAIRDLGCDNVVMFLAAEPQCVDADTLAYVRMKKGARAVVVVANWGQECGRDECAGLREVSSAQARREVLRAAEAMGCEILSLDMSPREFDHGRAVEELVRLIRQARPDTMVTRHSAEGTCAMGKGIRAAGERAFSDAAETSAFPEQLETGLAPWQARRFYERTRWWGNPTWEYNVTVPVGDLDPLRGKTYAEMGLAAWPVCSGCAKAMRAGGESGPAYYRLVACAPEVEEARTFLPDRSAAEVLEECLSSGSARRAVRGWESAIRSVQDGSLHDTPRLLRGLTRAADDLAEVRDSVSREPRDGTCAIRQGVDIRGLIQELDRATALAVGLETQVVEHTGKVWPGAEFEVVTSTRLVGGGSVSGLRVKPDLPGDISLVSVQADAAFLDIGEDTGRPAVFVEEVPPGGEVKVTFRLKVAETAELGESLEGQVEGGSELFLPFVTEFRTGKRSDVFHRIITPVRVKILPLVTVEVVPETPLVPSGTDAEMMVQIQVTNHSDQQWPNCYVALRSPEGFTITRQELPKLALLPFETASVAFWVRPKSVEPGEHVLRGMAIYGVEETELGGKGTPVVAAKSIIIGEVEAPDGVNVGLIRTCGSVLEDALESLGVPYSLLEPDEVTAADLGRWDVVVVDMGAYRKRPDVARHYKRLLRYIWRGGHLVVFGHTPVGWDSRFPPYPIELAAQPISPEKETARSVDQRIPMISGFCPRAPESPGPSFLEPEHPLLQKPNALEPADFEGWEGPWGRFFAVSWDEAYTALLSIQAGDNTDLVRGGYLVADYGYGSFIYTGCDWAKQLEESHIEAYRAFANMIAYPEYRERKVPEEASEGGEAETE